MLKHNRYTIFKTISICLIVSLLAQTKTIYCQDTAKYINLTTINPSSNTDDLKQLDNYFKDVTVVGMGESTHGTHEFFIMRHRMFKYLVKNHSFNTFFLEADYANCLRINSYIHGEKDRIYDVVDEIGMWPWITEEMADLINWMKSYNAINNNQLNFIGVDMQRYKSTIKRIHRLTIKYQLTTDVEVNKDFTDAEFMSAKKNEIESLTKSLNDYKVLNIDKLNKKDKIEYKLLIRHLNQIIEEKDNKKDYYYRDKKMAENILYHLNLDTTLKGFFWGHNAHISNYSEKKINTKRWRGCAGGYLKNKIGKQYFSLGQDFDEGSFNVYYPDTNSTKIIGGKGYTLGVVSVGLSFKESFPAIFRGVSSPAFIEFNNFPKQILSGKYILMNSIGALYFPSLVSEEKKRNRARYLFFKNDSFDAVILIEKSTPTHLLKKPVQ